MKKIIIIISLYFLFFTSTGYADQISEGTWQQTSSTAGDCSSCTISVKRLSPHIIQLSSNNNWVGFAVYDNEEDNYRGISEWEFGKGGVYEGNILILDIIHEGQTINCKFTSIEGTFKATYRKK